MEKRNNEYHGIIFNISQKDGSVFKSLNIIGKRRYLGGLLTIYKICVPVSYLDETIRRIQNNMRDGILFKKQEFYVHFYKQEELVIVFKDKVFRTTTDRSTWKEAIEYGVSRGIKEQQLDFKPCKIEEEEF
jgi:hypothetical protein